MAAAPKTFHERCVAILRQGLEDEDEGVRGEARRALRTVMFRNALQPLVRLFRESRDEAVRLTAIEAIADIKRRDAGLFLLEVVRSEAGPLFEMATRRLRSFPNADLLPIVRQLAEGERSPVKEALESILSGPQGEV
jgi:HEAT repeat protein